MSLRSFMKDIWQLIKDYKWVILSMTVITMILSLALVIFINNQIIPAEQSEDPAERDYHQVGMIDIYVDESGDNFQLEPHLPQEVISGLHEWNTFRAHFSLHTSDPDISEVTPASDFFSESTNPIEDFLGIDPTQHDNIRIHPDTGNAYMTYEINPENGSMRIVNVQEGFNDFRIQLDVEAEEGTFAENINEDADDLVNFKIGMTPGSEQFGYLESEYNWTSGLNFPRMFAQRKNFYINDPIAFIPSKALLDGDGLTIRNLILPGMISVIIGFILGVALVFIWTLFNKKIQYSFVYGWSIEDLYLRYEDTDNTKQITYDVLQSEFDHLAIITEQNLPENLSLEIRNTKSKNVNLYNEISEISLNSKVEEFVLVINRNQTTKAWYHRQRKHLKAYRQKAVKIVEI